VSTNLFIAASSGTSFVEAATLYPFEVIKTRQQVANSGFRPIASEMFQRTGVRGFYKGFSWSVIGGVPSDVGFWLSYNVFKDLLLAESGFNEPVVHLCAGAMAEVVGQFLYVPMDVISQRVQAQALPDRPVPLNYDSFRFKRVDGGVDVVRRIAARDGVAGFWRGFWISVGSQVPASAVQMAGYEYFRKLLPKYNDSLTQKHWATHLVAGGLAGALSVIVTNPLDVLKTRLQVAQTRITLTQAVDELLVRDGPRGFLRGMLPRICFTAPRNAIAFFLYEVALGVATPDN